MFKAWFFVQYPHDMGVEAEWIEVPLSTEYPCRTAAEMYQCILSLLHDGQPAEILDVEGGGWPFWPETVRAVIVTPA